MFQRLKRARDVLVGRIELSYIDVIREGRNPFPKGPPMSRDSQLERWNSLYKNLEIKVRYSLSFFEIKTYCIENYTEDFECRYILVPKRLTVEKLIEIIKNKSTDFEIVTDSLGSLCGLDDNRSNINEAYLVKMGESYENKSQYSGTTNLSENTVLERLLYYIMLYYESGSFQKFDQTTICQGTGDKRSIVEMKTERSIDNETGKILIMIRFSKINNLNLH
ncbi:MAG: hypothetical protein R3B60_03965 [Candidatus Paceibacterota bacterium]